jgi:hypothetical protein
MRTALAARLADVKGRYRALQEEADASATEWHWSRGLSDRGDLRPLASERDGRRLGRLTATRAAGRFASQDQVGLDSEGRVVVVRKHDGLGDVTYETFVFHDTARSEAIHFQSPRVGPHYSWPEEVVNVSWYSFDESRRPTAWHRTFANGGFEWERYHHDEAGRLLGIDCHFDLAPEAGDGVHRVQRCMRLTPRYGQDGALTALDEEIDGPSGGRRRVWRLPSERKKVAAWQRAAHDGLVRRILEAVGRAAGDERVAAVGIVYDDAGPVLPPTLGVLTEAEHDRLLAVAGDREFPWYLWNPAEWSRFDTPDLSLRDEPEPLGVMEELALEWELGGGHEDGRRMLVAVARELNEREWPLATTADFVVFASDLELTETTKNARAAVPKDRLRALERGGRLLPDDDD